MANLSGSKTGKLTPPMLRSFRRLQHKCTLAELEYYFPISKAQACRIRAGQHWNKQRL